MTPSELESKLRTLSPDARVSVRDLTGTQDHYEAWIVSDSFINQLTLERHRSVLSLVQEDINSGAVHALSLKTYTYEQAKNLSIPGEL